MTTVNHSFAAGETKRFPGGKFFKIKSAVYDVEVVFYNSNGGELGRADFSQGDAINSVDGFAYAEVTSAAGQVVVVHALPFIMSSSNLVGDVNALTRAYVETDSNNEFMTGCYGSQSAGNYSATALLNPAGSQKILEVSSLKACCASNYSIGVISEAALTGFAGMLNLSALYGYGPKNKYYGQADSVMVVYGGNVGVAPYTGNYIQSVIGNTFLITELLTQNKPVKIPEGYALIGSVTGAVNVPASMMLEFKEV